MADDRGKCELPLSRVRTIMKSSPDVNNINQEALFLAAKATEMFIQSLAQVSLEQSSDKGLLKYNDLAEIVDGIDTLQFLQDIIPKKIKASEYFAMMKKWEEENGGDSDT
ncbi:chromatin accessibility complex protein 1-like [Mercenaria mercenaria]|uniref:chromatin accessibility complex protein 1-like n=1 Tax=Mercenaria mercenaria TaxID=6596 RepID=UPI001E1D6E5E|nr:chromatin accessibility complex protein 1-like [Mercenaria mercenaria]